MGTLEINIPSQGPVSERVEEPKGLITPVEAEFHQALEDVGPDQRAPGRLYEKNAGPYRAAQLSDLEKESKEFYQEHISGIAYLTEIVHQTAKHAEPAYIARLLVLQGASTNIHYEYHELTVASEQVLEAVLRYEENLAGDGKVLVRFKMLNPRARAFFYQAEGNEVRLGSSITGLLTHIEPVADQKPIPSSEPGPAKPGDEEHADFTFERS